MRLRRVIMVLTVNSIAIAVIYGFTAGFMSIGALIRERSLSRADTSIGTDDAKMLFDKKLLVDRDKYDASLEKVKEKYRRLKTSNPTLYLKVPEGEFVKSIIYFFVIAPNLGKKKVVLDDTIVQGFRKQGIVLYSMDKNYPLMKKSIYLDGSGGGYPKPTIRRGTNFIIIFVESLSQFFLREDVHGVKGLTPTIAEIGRGSMKFTRMINASYPTLKGLIAALGSTVYLLDESIGGTRITVPCRFLFLSNILKAMGYATIHMQAGSERFIGMKDMFTKRQGYDLFYGSESLAIRNIASMKGGFGVDDEILFQAVVEWLDTYDNKKPFLLTISTINTHPPFKVRYRAPQSKGSDLLDSLYSTDRAIGLLWDYFKTSKYRHNTVVILTADHAMGNCKDYNEFAGRFEEYYHPFFDIIPCMVRFPDGAPWNGVAVDTSCTSLDFLPTILDMMNIDLPNPFMGLSIFGDRRRIAASSTGGGNNLMAGISKEGEFDPSKIDRATFEQAKKVIDFFFNIYTTDSILPPDYRVRLH